MAATRPPQGWARWRVHRFATEGSGTAARRHYYLVDLSAFLARRDGVILATDLLRIGIDTRRLRSLCDRGELVRLRRGAYVPTEDWEDATPERQHLLRTKATVASLPEGSVLSHYSAAAAHRLPIFGRWPSDVHVLGARHRGGHGETGLRRHGTVNPPEPVEVDGMLATSVARTVVDLARTSSFRSAVVTADCALANATRGATFAGSVSREGLLRELDAVPKRSGKARAQRVVEFSNGLSGSVGESVTRAVFLDLGIPCPQLQKQFVDDQGEMFVDFYWEEFNAIGEFDGKIKYFDPGFAQGLSPDEVLWKEKQRQDRLLAFTPRIARWDWEVVLNPRRLLTRLATIGIHPVN